MPEKGALGAVGDAVGAIVVVLKVVDGAVVLVDVGVEEAEEGGEDAPFLGRYLIPVAGQVDLEPSVAVSLAA